MKNRIAKILIPWILVFGLVEIFFAELITLNNHILATLYFILVATTIVILYRDLLETITKDTKKKQYLFLFIPLVIHVIVYWFCINYLTEPTKLIKDNAASFLLVNKYFLWSKPFHILSQQLFIIILVLKLHRNKIGLRRVMLYTMILFGLSHTFLIRSMTLPFALYFTGFAIVGSFVLPYMILKVKNGYLYNLVIHLAFYDLSALFFWSKYQ